MTRGELIRFGVPGVRAGAAGCCSWGVRGRTTAGCVPSIGIVELGVPDVSGTVAAFVAFIVSGIAVGLFIGFLKRVGHPS
jgi:hypothetical protein